MAIQIGVVGTGWFAKKHAGMLAAMEDVQVAAICGTSKEKADKLAAEFDGARGYGKASDMLEGRKLDALYICVPPFAHGEIEELALAHGIPFFVEKPLGVDLDLPTRILAGVREKGLITSVGYHFRYMDGTATAKHFLTHATAGIAVGSWIGGMPGVPWWRKQQQSGGQFVEQTTHIVDLVRYLLGEVIEVYAAYGQRVMHKKEEGVEVPDVGAVTLKLASGAVVSLSTACMVEHSSAVGLTVYTDQGIAQVTGGGLTIAGGPHAKEVTNVTDPYQREHAAFIQALRTGDVSGILSTYEDAWLTQQVTVSANTSARTGQPVLLSPLHSAALL